MNRLLQDETQTQDSKGLTNPNNCATCDHKRYPDGGHCYMFRHAPEEVCYLHTARALNTISLLEIARVLSPEPPPTEDQLAAQDSMWGVTIEENHD